MSHHSQRFPSCEKRVGSLWEFPCPSVIMISHGSKERQRPRSCSVSNHAGIRKRGSRRDVFSLTIAGCVKSGGGRKPASSSHWSGGGGDNGFARMKWPSMSQLWLFAFVRQFITGAQSGALHRFRSRATNWEPIVSNGKRDLS